MPEYNPLYKTVESIGPLPTGIEPAIGLLATQTTSILLIRAHAGSVYSGHFEATAEQHRTMIGNAALEGASKAEVVQESQEQAALYHQEHRRAQEGIVLSQRVLELRKQMAKRTHVASALLGTVIGISAAVGFLHHQVEQPQQSITEQTETGHQATNGVASDIVLGLASGAAGGAIGFGLTNDRFANLMVKRKAQKQLHQAEKAEQ